MTEKSPLEQSEKPTPDLSDRRQFLRSLGSAGVAAATIAAFPPEIRAALAVQANSTTGTINDIEHVVILMLENRSFDHYFGTLRGVQGFGDAYTIPQPNGRSIWQQLDISDGVRMPFHLDSCGPNKALKAETTAHQVGDAQAAWSHGRYGEWAKFKDVPGRPGTSMGYFRRKDIPFHFALADAFTVCDAYFCSVHGSTSPNRAILFSGTNADPKLREAGVNCNEDQSEPRNLRGFTSGGAVNPVHGGGLKPHAWLTIPEILETSGVSWKIYQDPSNNFDGQMNGGLMFDRFMHAHNREVKLGDGYDRHPNTPATAVPLRDPSPAKQTALADAIKLKGMTAHSLDDLYQDAVGSTAAQPGGRRLPSVSWILPSQDQSDHPSGSNPLTGGHFISQVLDALVRGGVWGKTALLVMYDENDGFFDHVPPPAPPSLDAGGNPLGGSTISTAGEYFDGTKQNFNTYYAGNSTASTDPLRPWGLGPRVPMIVVSPWSRGGWVNSQVFSHASIGLFLEKRFGINLGKNISDWNRSVCGDLTTAFNFSNPNATPPNYGLMHANFDTDQKVSLFEQTRPAEVHPGSGLSLPLIQENANALRCGLPYRLDLTQFVWPWLNPPHVFVNFINSGTVGAVFHVYDALRPTDVPKRFTVGANSSLSTKLGEFSMPKLDDYDFFIVGPAGFHRRLKGNFGGAGYSSRVNPDVRFILKPETETLELLLTNSGTHACWFTVGINKCPGSDMPARTVLVASNYSSRLSFPISSSGGTGGWFDVTVTSSSAPGFERTAAGRLETGAPGLTNARTLGIQPPYASCAAGGRGSEA